MANLISYRRYLGAIVVALSLTGLASAQYRPYPRYFPPYGYNPYGGPGGVYAGQAELVKSAGNLMVDQEKARIEREKANQAKIDTRKKAFDENAYEKHYTPTYSEDQTLVKNRTLNRVLVKPEKSEITKGITLNVMMPYIRELSDKGISGPPIPLNQYLLNEVNVTVGRGSTNVGMLKDASNLRWPIALQGEMQKEADKNIRALVKQAKSGKQVDAKLYIETTKMLARMQTELSRKYRKEEIDSRMYLNGKHFLDPLENAIRDLDMPSTQRLVAGGYEAKGNTVPELVYNMTSQGLAFAPANPGNEAAYYSLNDAFSSYIQSAQSTSGFRPQLRPDLPASLSQK